MSQERLQKIIARAGISSRRAAEELIAKGRVRVNGAIVSELGTRVDPRQDKVEVDGRRIVAESPVYLVLHKPRGVVSTVSDPEGRPTVRELLPGISERIFPVGRLDFHTSGVLLLTNDGEFCDGMLHPKRDVPKTYVAKVAGEMREPDRKRWEEGVVIDGVKTRSAEVFTLRYEQGKTWIEVTLYEGRNQQIRKMGDATGFKILRLARTSFAGVTSEGLRPGDSRALTPTELAHLRDTYGVPRRMPRRDAPQAAPSAAPGRSRASRGARAASGRSPGPRSEGPSRGRQVSKGDTRRPERGDARRPERGDARRPERADGKRFEGGPRDARRPERGDARRPERADGKRFEGGPRDTRRPERVDARRPERVDARRPERGEASGSQPSRGRGGAGRTADRPSGGKSMSQRDATKGQRALTPRGTASTRKTGG